MEKKFFLANFAKKKFLIRGSPKKKNWSEEVKKKKKKKKNWSAEEKKKKKKKKNSVRKNPDHAPPMINGRPLKPVGGGHSPA